MITVTKRFEFDAAHRIMGHPGKCKHLHGHHYVAEVTVRGQGDNLNSLDMVMDFVDFKKVKEWIDEYWDHNIILSYHDPLARLHHLGNTELFQGKTPYIMGSAGTKSQNPTAEMMCFHLGATATALLNVPSRIAVVKVRIYETPTCWAEWIPQVEMFHFSTQVQGETSLKGKFKSGVKVADEQDNIIKGDTQG